MEYTRIIVTGKVQGVFFRASTKVVADRLKMVGTVRNLSNGDVEIVAAGEKMEDLINWCYIGSRGSKVENVHTDLIKIDENYKDFHIKY